MNLFFDLDGTLTDPAAGITGCIRHALEAMERPAPEAEELHRFIGPPLALTFSELLETEDEDTIWKALGHYRERFGTVGLFENEIYPDIPEMLAALLSAGHRLWVVTSKPHVYATRIVEHFAIHTHFEKVYGSELSGENVEKRDLIRVVVQNEGIDPSKTVMIGDRKHDVIGARANDIAAIGVLWGYGSREELMEAGASSVAATVAELRHTLLNR